MSASSKDDHEDGTATPATLDTDKPRRARPLSVASAPAAAGSPEGRYVGGPGRRLYRQVVDLLRDSSDAAAQEAELEHAVARAMPIDQERNANHRGGDRTWLLRLLILPGVAAEALTAFIAMEALVRASTSLSDCRC